MDDRPDRPAKGRVALALAVLRLASLVHRVRLRARYGREWERFDTWRQDEDPR